MQAFLAAAAQEERRRLTDLLLIVAIGGQGERETITRLQRSLDHED